METGNRKGFIIVLFSVVLAKTIEKKEKKEVLNSCFFQYIVILLVNI